MQGSGGASNIGRCSNNELSHCSLRHDLPISWTFTNITAAPASTRAASAPGKHCRARMFWPQYARRSGRHGCPAYQLCRVVRCGLVIFWGRMLCGRRSSSARRLTPLAPGRPPSSSQGPGSPGAHDSSSTGSSLTPAAATCSGTACAYMKDVKWHASAWASTWPSLEPCSLQRQGVRHLFELPLLACCTPTCNACRACCLACTLLKL